jgi:predicted nuclease with TOPRIM domain
LTSADTPAASPPKRAKQTGKDDKYHDRRQKNNVASQVSRSKRRAKHKDMFSRVEELELANAQLRERVQEMEGEAAQLRKRLVQKLSS